MFKKILSFIFGIKPDLQETNVRFCLRCFGFSNTYDRHERALRFAEEAVELCQATELTITDMIKIVEHVYSRPVGTVRKEVANAQLTLMALAASYSIHAEDQAWSELNESNNLILEIQDKYKEKPDFIRSPGMPIEHSYVLPT